MRTEGSHHMTLAPLHLVHALVVIGEQGLHHPTSDIPVRRLEFLHQLLGAPPSSALLLLNHAQALLHLPPDLRQIVHGGGQSAQGRVVRVVGNGGGRVGDADRGNGGLDGLIRVVVPLVGEDARREVGRQTVDLDQLRGARRTARSKGTIFRRAPDDERGRPIPTGGQGLSCGRGGGVRRRTAVRLAISAYAAVPVRVSMTRAWLCVGGIQSFSERGGGRRLDVGAVHRGWVSLPVSGHGAGATPTRGKVIGEKRVGMYWG
jgi:hypothetical protein